MSEEGASFEIDLPVKGQPALDAAATSLEKIQGTGTAASKAATALSDAIKAGEGSYRKAEQAADAAAKAVERIGLAAGAQRGKLQVSTELGDDKGAARAAASLRLLTERQAEAQDKATAAKAAMLQEATALDKLRERQDKENESAEKAEPALGKLERGLHKLGGPLGDTAAQAVGLVHGWDRIRESLGDNGPIVAASVAVVALTAAVIAAGVAFAAGVVKVVAWSVGLADANRSASLLTQGIARSVAGGQQLDDRISDLTKTLPLTREELSSTAERLANAGLRGNALTTALEKSAIAAAKLKFGPDFEEQMLSLDEQSKVFHANISETFGGLKVEGLLGGLQKLGALFDSNTASGRAMKVVFESIFQPIVDGATNAVPKVERFFIQLEILAVRAMLAIKPYGSTILKVGEAFAIGAAIIVGFFVASIALATGLILGAVAAVGYLAAGIKVQIDAWINLGRTIVGFFQGVDLVAMGRAMIDGLVNGITGGAKAVVDAMKGVVTGAVDGAKHLLGIASPSKVFAEIGMQTGAGMSVGVDRSSVGVQDSLERMVAPPSAQPSAAAPPAPTAHAGGSMSGNTFNFYGVQGAEDALERFEDMLTRVLEGDAAQLGAAVPN
jgi:hypothetical protein